MSKIKTLSLIFIGSVIHFCLMLKVIADRLTCDVQPHCVSLINKIGGVILAFPLGWVGSALDYFSVNMNSRGAIGEVLFFSYFIINPILAVVLFWLLLIRPLVRWKKEKNKRGCNTFE
jgi:hypothetical protein